MKAILFERLGGPEVLKLAVTPTPELRRGKILIKNHAVGINFADTLFRQGEYVMQPKLPDTPGLEASGIVEAIGEGVEDIKVGDRVAAIGMKTYAEYSLASAEQAIRLPDAVSFEDGAAFPIQVLTAYHMLFTAHNLTSDQTVIVHSAAGGVGLAAVQIAKAGGARVIGTVSSDEKADVVRKYGADEVINYAQNDFSEETRKITDGKGADLILDAVDKPTVEKGLNCLGPFGHLILYGRAGGVPDPVNLFSLFQKSIKVSGFILYTVSAIPSLHKKGITESLKLMEEGKLKIVVGQTFPLSEAAEAHRHMESRKSVGKLVLIP